MFGLDDKGKKKKEPFAFDLEKQIKSEPEFGKQLSETVEQKIADVKKLLRAGANEEKFDRLGVLLNGYTAFQRVLKKISK